MHSHLSFTNKLEVNLSAFRENVKSVLSIIERKHFICAIVKSNAYGLGAEEISKILFEEGIFNFGVFNVDEAQRLSFLGKENLKILIFGSMTSEDIKVVVENPHWIPVISSYHDLKLFSKSVSKPHSIHIKINMGMSRLGFEEEDIPNVISFLKDNKNLKLDGICGHLPKSSQIMNTSDEIKNQIKRFKNLCDKFSSDFPDLKNHLFNSVSVLACMTYNIDMEFGVRLGGILYGIKPEPSFKNVLFHKKWQDMRLRSVSSLKSYITSVREIAKGQGVSYDWSWVAPKPSKVAVVSMGYADGFWRSLSNRAHVLFRGKKAPVVGNVCMNFFMIDVTDFKNPQMGEEIVIYGRQGELFVSVDEWAEKAGTIAYEVMTSVGATFQRVYKNSF